MEDFFIYQILNVSVTFLQQFASACRMEKCVFMAETIVFLWYEISKQGIKPKTCKVETLRKAPYPENQSQLISFLGAVQYYSRHIPNMSTIIEPLNKLRSSQSPWRFGDEEKRAFDKLRELLSKLLTRSYLLSWTQIRPVLGSEVCCHTSYLTARKKWSRWYPEHWEKLKETTLKWKRKHWGLFGR